MPITVHAPIRRLSQEEFGQVSFGVMNEVFRLREELGPHFSEEVFKKALAQRLPSVRLEVPVEVAFGSFQKWYSLDVLVGEGGLFEFKGVDVFSPRHSGQLLNYLLLCDLAHGKLVNVRPRRVRHEFVNAPLTRTERQQFSLEDELWDRDIPGANVLRETLLGLLKDWGTGLEVALYADALVHLFGGPEAAIGRADVSLDGQFVATQRFRLAAHGVAFKLTSYEEPLEHFEQNSALLLKHTNLKFILWANISQRTVTLRTIRRSS